MDPSLIQPREDVINLRDVDYDMPVHVNLTFQASAIFGRPGIEAELAEGTFPKMLRTPRQRRIYEELQSMCNKKD